MIGYVTLGTNNLAQAASFYDQVLAQMDAKRFMENENFIAWSRNPAEPGLSLTKPFDGKTASVGNGVMVALNVASPEQVHAVYDKAIELGAKDEGPAGPREDMEGFYAGYFRDLDGNKLSVFCVKK